MNNYVDIQSNMAFARLFTSIMGQVFGDVEYIPSEDDSAQDVLTLGVPLIFNFANNEIPMDQIYDSVMDSLWADKVGLALLYFSTISVNITPDTAEDLLEGIAAAAIASYTRTMSVLAAFADETPDKFNPFLTEDI